MTREITRRVATSRLFFLSVLTSLDGSVAVLAATGRLSTLAGAGVAGLTVVGGVGCWLSARTEYGQRRLRGQDYVVLAVKGLLVLLSTLAAAAVGLAVGAAGTLRYLPIGGGIVFALLALEVGGLELPRVGRVPLTLLVLALSILVEVASRWIP